MGSTIDSGEVCHADRNNGIVPDIKLYNGQLNVKCAAGTRGSDQQLMMVSEHPKLQKILLE